MKRHSLYYLAGATLCALINNILLIAVDAFGGALIVGVILSWLIGGTTGFMWHSRLTYRSPVTSLAYVRFMAGALVGVPLAWAVLWLFTKVWAWPMGLSGPATTIILFCYHYCSTFVAIHWIKVRAPLRTTDPF